MIAIYGARAEICDAALPGVKSRGLSPERSAGGDSSKKKFEQEERNWAEAALAVASAFIAL